MSVNQFEFTAAGANISTYKNLTDASSDRACDPQAVRVMASSATSSGSATVELALVDIRTDTVVFRDQATVAPGSLRTGADGSSGDYICSVVFSSSSKDTADLNGSRIGGSGVNQLRWKIGVPSLTTITSLSLYVAETPVI